MIITKKHKIYYKSRKGEVKNLYKSAPSVYLEVISEFIENKGIEKYAHLNRDVKRMHKYQPLPVKIDQSYSDEFDRLLKEVGEGASMVVSYNNTWQPLALLTLGAVIVGVPPADSRETIKKQETLIAIISKNIETFNKWAQNKKLFLSSGQAFAEDKAFKYVPVHDMSDTTGKRFDYYEVIEDWNGAAELIGIVESRLKKD